MPEDIQKVQIINTHDSVFFSEEDIDLVAQQAGVDREKARSALIEAKGDLARAILLLTTG